VWPAPNVGSPCRLRHAVAGDAVVVGLTTILPGPVPTLARADFLCTNDGFLVRFLPEGNRGDDRATCWAIPRFVLDETVFDAYTTYWRIPDEPRSGRNADLGGSEAYAGVSPWEDRGDTARRLSPRHPAVIARSDAAGLSLGVVLVGAEERWASTRTFLQRYDARSLYLFPGIASRRAATRGLWAWLAPLPTDGSAAGSKVARLAETGPTLVGGFRSIAPEPEEHWTKSQTDFPSALRRPRPVDDVRRAIVFTINEPILSEEGLAHSASWSQTGTA